MPQDNNVVLEDVKIIFRNFSGLEGMYNKAGDRNFAVVLPMPIAEQMVRDGWNVKIKPPNAEGEQQDPFLPVTVKMDGRRPPLIRMLTSRGATDLDEESVGVLDFADIAQIDLIIRPYDWDVNGAKGRKAYLQDMYVTIIENPLELKYGNTAQIATVEGPMMTPMDPLIVED